LPQGANIFGIVSSADGKLYLSGTTDIYQLDPATMQASLYYNYKTTTRSIWGLANFNDNCNAPEPHCEVTVDIKVLTPQPYCRESGVYIQAEGKGLTGSGKYQWHFPDGSTASTISITATITGWYKIVLTESGSNCTDQDSIYLEVLKKPLADLGEDSILCVNTTINLANNKGEASHQYLWQDGSTAPQFTATTGGKYWLRVTNACGVASDTLLLQNKTLPQVALGADRTLCLYDTAHLTNLQHAPGIQYQWSTGATGIKLVADKPALYWLAATNTCGTVKDSVVMIEKKEGCECFMHVPTAFTPNSDGKNDLFHVRSNCIAVGELTIYNRWGRLVYRSKDVSKGWNGHYNGQLQPNGVYIFQVSYSFANRPGHFVQKGTVMLIR
jgi:gliding motility-associated-like protein